jgi:hypothetical protein
MIDGREISAPASEGSADGGEAARAGIKDLKSADDASFRSIPGSAGHLGRFRSAPGIQD